MIFDVYFPFKNRAGVTCPGIVPKPMNWAEIMQLCTTVEHAAKVDKVRSDGLSKEERAEAKKNVPAICITGTTTRTRAQVNMKPTGLYMIDIDHCENPREAYQEIYDRMEESFRKSCLAFAHITVGGNGLRFAMRAVTGCSTLEDNMEWFRRTFEADKYGDFDAPCKDFSRISFLPKSEDFLFVNEAVIRDDVSWNDGDLVNPFYDENSEASQSRKKPAPAKQGQLFSDAETIENFTDEEKQTFENYEYRGTLVKVIIDKWVELNGTPGAGEIHNYYNDMVKNFRNIVSNNKRALLYLLPRFGHDAAECWSSIKSICKVNTLSTLPKQFYFFLKDNGFYGKKSALTGSLAEYMLRDEEDVKPEEMPWLPPVFREFIRITPKDFRPAMANALMPVMGTLASYLQAPYYYDGRLHTPSFFSIIYAPAGTGKGFVERIIDRLFEQLKIRDYVQQAREDIYLAEYNRKSQNDKNPKDPHTTMRIIPPKNSETEFLETMRDCQGYHLFTFAAEMDSWAKGVRAAGGNKDDMIRIAWDNGKYGQQFKNPGTFKGTVNLYWNVLITGTIQQLMSYFKNVENGLITRCAFTTIENQEFAPPPIWKDLNKKETDVLKKFMERCDRNTYEEPCNLIPEEVDCVDPEKFDEEVNWKFKFRKKKTVDMGWLRPTIDAFLKDQMERAAVDFDRARDVFRRRVAVRGFRLGLLCYALWENPRRSDLEKCIPFIEWWMEQDIESSLKLWGVRYNNETESGPTLTQRSLYNELPEQFDNKDVFIACQKMQIKTPVRNITSKWRTMGYVKNLGKGMYEKTNPETNSASNQQK